jgi:PAS domain-containing protein
MILRLWRARLRPETEAELLDRLRVRVLALQRQGSAGPLDVRYGFRHESGATSILGLTVWADYRTLLDATDGDLSRSIRPAALDDLCETTRADTFERIGPAPEQLQLTHGRILGLVTARIKPNHESSVQAMVDVSARQAIDAGALAAHRGRRLAETTTEIAVVVEWPDRETLRRFVRSRSAGALDPRFTEQLEEWQFETYAIVTPDRLLVPSAGPAVLLADDTGAYVDATPGVERVLGIVPELLFGRRVLDIVTEPDEAVARWSRFREDGEQEGLIDIRRPDGVLVRARYRAAADAAGAGLHGSVLCALDEVPDPRPIREIVAEAFPQVAVAAGSNAAAP